MPSGSGRRGARIDFNSEPATFVGAIFPGEMPVPPEPALGE